MRWRRSRSTDLDDGAGTGAVDGGAEPTAMGLRRRRAGALPRTFSVSTTRRAGDAGCCFGVRDDLCEAGLLAQLGLGVVCVTTLFVLRRFDVGCSVWD